MKRVRVDNHIERRMLIGMITSSGYMRKAWEMIDPQLIEIPYGQTVARWCLDYYQEHNEAPGRHIQDIYYQKRRSIIDKDEREMVKSFLGSLSDEFIEADKLNVQYLLEQTEKRLNLQKLKELYDNIEEALDLEDPDMADTLLRQHKQITQGMDDSFDPFDEEEIADTLTDDEDPIVHFSGAMGDMLNPHMVRGGFVVAMGPEKRGKSWMLYEMALQAFKCRNNVVLFEAGDLTKRQAKKRIHARLSRKGYMKNAVGLIQVPVDIEDGDGEIIPGKNIVYNEVMVKEPLSYEDMMATRKKFLARTKGKRFKISSHAHDLTVEKMIRLLDKWEREEGFVPDVIVLDYPDIVDVEDKRLDERGRENKKWAMLRGMAKDRNGLVLAVTQADADSYDKKSLGIKNFSIDKRKMAHVTGLFGLNQTPEEKAAGVMRLGWVVVREGEAMIGRECYVLQCLKMARPHITSFYL